MDDLAMSHSEQATCRICRSEGAPDEPLFHPCRCSGSIGHVHQECLVEWLSHSQKKHCELCKTPFRFTKLYDAHMPDSLPWRVFVRNAAWDTWSTIFSVGRTAFVAWVWLIILPWLIRWAWRWMFWFADAGWAREEYLQRQYVSSLNTTTSVVTSTLMAEARGSWSSAIFGDLRVSRQMDNSTALRLAFGLVGDLLGSIGIDTFANRTHFDTSGSDSSIFSSLSYLSSLTPYAPLNRVILDIFEGQLITCTVILSFILIFLIREWVVQQQPLVNLDLAAHQHDHHDRAPAQPEPILDQQQLVDQDDDRYRAVVAARIERLRADIEADYESLQTLEDRVQAERQGLAHTMPELDVYSRVTQIRQSLDEADRTINALPDHIAMAPNTSSVVARKASNAIDVRPITNAGIDARTNIKWRRGVDPTTVMPPSDDDPSILTNGELTERLQRDPQPSAVLAGSTAETDTAQAAGNDNGADSQVDTDRLQQDAQSSAAADLDWPTAVDDTAGSFSFTSASDSQDDVGQPTVDATLPTDTEVGDEGLADEAPRRPLRRTLFDKLADWFWDGIEVNAAAQDQVIVIDEQRLGLVANEAPFVPINHVQDHHRDNIEPEAADAAEQAGLDGDAFGDGGEEMEGLLELIGIRGPIIGMLQTSLFCLLLVASTVLAAVVIPYVWGKAVLGFVGSPIYFLVILPLRVMSFVADFVVDATLFSGGWILTLSAVATEAVLTSLSTIWPRIITIGVIVTKISNAALREASASGERLRGMFSGPTAGDPFNFNEGVLGASAHAHASLKEISGEVDAVMNFTSNLVYQSANIAITGNFSSVQSGIHDVLAYLPGTPQRVKDAASVTLSTASNILGGLKNGNIALPMAHKPSSFDPALIYWNSVDRSLAVATGYLALAALAAVYVASAVSFTSSASGRKVEKLARDSLRQAGGVLKVILIISIEMLVFPAYCGLLLDIAFLPLFGENALTTRLAFAASRPYIFCFVHWFLGTYYMFHFALFVGMCRNVLRKGVLWFIRDPDDPTFHPVRDVLERNVMTQLRKIAFSALVYGALVILCLGGVIWSIGKLFTSIFPIVWRDTEPVFEFPMDLFLYNFLTPLVITFVKPSEGLQAAYAWWLRRCARLLRLSHFLFGQRMHDEEGHYVFPTWSSMILMPVLDLNDGSVKINEKKDGDDETRSKIEFISDGGYVFTPCHDQYRPPKPNETYFSVTTENDVDIVDQDGKHHPHWSKVYLPPHFKLRVMLFMVCLWIFSAFAGVCVTFVPLTFGRRLLAALLPTTPLNDIYAYTIGVYILGGTLYAFLKGRAALLASRQSASGDVALVLARARRSAVKLGKCAYVYGYIFIIQPLLTAGLLEMYGLMPLHTFLAININVTINDDHASTDTATNGTASQSVGQSPTWKAHLAGVSANDYTVVNHDVHFALDFALAVLLIRLIAQFIAAEPRTRAAEALRRATKDGIFDPDAWVVTRYLALPTIVISSIFLTAPVMGSSIAVALLRRSGITVSPSFETLLYRFSFPTFEALLVLLLLLVALGGVTTRWRARIRDEVYLVGERLHNYGEKKPPTGTKSIMRRERTSV